MTGTTTKTSARSKNENELMRKKKIIQLLFGMIVLISFFISQTALVQAYTVKTITNVWVEAYMQRYNGGWENLNVPHYYVVGGTSYQQEVYCIEASKGSPNGTTYDIDNNRFSAYAARSRTALAVILKSGHPKKSLGLGTNYDRYATAMAVKFWMGYVNSYTYAAYRLNAYTDAQLRTYAAQGAIPGKIRMLPGRPAAILQKAIDLYLLAKNEVENSSTGGLNTSVTANGFTVSNSAGSSTTTKGLLNYSSSVSTQMKTYSVRTPSLPTGVTVTGGTTGANGSTIKFSVDPSLAETYSSIPVSFTVSDPTLERTAATMFITPDPINHSNRQRMAWVKSDSVGYADVTSMWIPVPYDLKVDSITTNASSYNNGSSIIVTVRVRNNSKTTAPSYTLRVSGNNNYGIQNISGGALAAGSYRNHTFTYSAKIHPTNTAVTFTTIIDPNDTLAEATRVNNTGSRAVTVNAGLPELVPSIISRSGSTDKNTFNPGEPITVVLRTTNSGLSTAGNTANWWSWRDNYSGTGGDTRAADKASIASGSYRDDIKTYMPAVRRNSYSVTFGYEIDYAKWVTESNESNNVTHKSVTVNAAPDLLITNASINTTQINPGSSGIITVTVKNDGLVSVPENSLLNAISVSHGTLTPTTGRTVGNLGPGASVNYTFTWTSPANIPQGTAVTLRFKVDANNNVVEYNEDNNERTITFTPMWLDLAVVESTAQNYFTDKDVVISALIRNNSNIDVLEAEIRLSFDSSILLETISLPANSSNRAIFRIRTPSEPGQYAIVLTVDPHNKLDESDRTNNTLTQTVTVANENRVPMPDPDSPALEQHYLTQGKTLTGFSLPASQRIHSWQEIRLEGSSYVTKTYWMQMDTVFSINPDPRVAIPGKPDLLESGFGIESNAEMVITTNYDRPDKLVGPQMVYLFYPEATYGKSPFTNCADSLEILSGDKGTYISRWRFAVSSFSLTGSRLHYTPLWTPDGPYNVLAQSFYAWSPVGQMYDFKSDSVTIEGDMYDRVTVVRR